MNKAELIDELVQRSASDYTSPLTKKQAAAALDCLADVARLQLGIRKSELTLPGIGKLKAVAKAARTGRNPKTGEAMEIAAHTGVKFGIAKSLKDALA